MATHIKPLIEHFFKKKQKDLKKQDQLKEILDRFLDQETKKHIYPEEVKKNTLFFKSDSSAFTYTFNLYKNKILEEAKKVWPEINKIRVELK